MCSGSSLIFFDFVSKTQLFVRWYCPSRMTDLNLLIKYDNKKTTRIRRRSECLDCPLRYLQKLAF